MDLKIDDLVSLLSVIGPFGTCTSTLISFITIGLVGKTKGKHWVLGPGVRPIVGGQDSEFVEQGWYLNQNHYLFF